MKGFLHWLAAVALALGVAAANAQGYPAKPIRLIVPFPAGGGVDAVARITAQRMSDILGQPVTVENRAGAGGAIGADAAAKSPPDGYTLLVASPAEIVIMVNSGGPLPYNPVRDLTPVTLLGETPLVLAAHSGFPVKSLRDAIDLAKKQPGKVSYGTPGNGSSMHFAGASLELLASIHLLHVPYKGAAPATTDLLGGTVNLAIVGMPPMLQHVKSGKVRALAVTSEKRSAALPDVPTVGEVINARNFRFTNWMGVFAPAKTPDAVLQRLSTVLRASVSQPEVRDRLLAIGVEPAGLSISEFRSFLINEGARYARISKDRNITSVPE